MKRNEKNTREKIRDPEDDSTFSVSNRVTSQIFLCTPNVRFRAWSAKDGMAQVQDWFAVMNMSSKYRRKKAGALKLLD